MNQHQGFIQKAEFLSPDYNIPMNKVKTKVRKSFNQSAIIESFAASQFAPVQVQMLAKNSSQQKLLYQQDLKPEISPQSNQRKCIQSTEFFKIKMLKVHNKQSDLNSRSIQLAPQSNKNSRLNPIQIGQQQQANEKLFKEINLKQKKQITNKSKKLLTPCQSKEKNQKIKNQKVLNENDSQQICRENAPIKKNKSFQLLSQENLNLFDKKKVTQTKQKLKRLVEDCDQNLQIAEQHQQTSTAQIRQKLQSKQTYNDFPKEKETNTLNIPQQENRDISNSVYSFQNQNQYWLNPQINILEDSQADLERYSLTSSEDEEDEKINLMKSVQLYPVVSFDNSINRTFKESEIKSSCKIKQNDFMGELSPQQTSQNQNNPYKISKHLSRTMKQSRSSQGKEFTEKLPDIDLSTSFSQFQNENYLIPTRSSNIESEKNPNNIKINQDSLEVRQFFRSKTNKKGNLQRKITMKNQIKIRNLQKSCNLFQDNLEENYELKVNSVDIPKENQTQKEQQSSKL